MENSFQKFSIKADTIGNLTTKSQRTSMFFLSVKEFKERFNYDYSVAIEEFHNKQQKLKH